MSRITIAALASALVVLAAGATGADAATISLALPQSTAFSILGHSCGGIQEQSYATGFDAASGYPVGDVYLQTRCGGSGRGGGYRTTTYTAWAAVGWDFGGGVRSAASTTAAVVDGSLSVTDASGDHLYNASGHAYLDVPAPGAPTGVTAVQVNDQLQVSWTPAPPNPAVITSSTLTATPVGSSAPVVTTTVSGSASIGLVGPLQPATTYAVTVVSTTVGGSSAPADAVTVTTAAASVPPGAPTGVTARWLNGSALYATWQAAAAGDSPIDSYQVQAVGSDGGGTVTQTADGAMLSATFAVSTTPDWSVTVRAHNASGWGPWSAAVTLGGL